ncbi:hypothetical protein [Paraburkholderia sp. BCC1886]|uniref:hypothetical protein n=1 Tax=Paraburkholderia sp. BCC1886 TaxID=2562670 RepID=UPI001183E59C|nr:hypothetical protein [Paraburkholderia sp. BCC1886]
MTHDVEKNSEISEQSNPPSSNLVTWVTELLQEKGHPRPHDWLKHLQAGVDSLEDQNYQRFAINRAWRVIIGRLNEVKQIDTMDVRYSLVDREGSVDDWKRLFTVGVLPCIMTHELPLLA